MVYCRDDAFIQQEYVEETIAARQRLAPFNTLRNTFNNFYGYGAEHYKHNNNIIFWMCRKFYYENAQRLNKSEKALSVFKKQWTSKEYREFVGRLTSKKRFKSYTAFTEIITAFDIGERIGFDNIDLYHQIRKSQTYF